MTYWIKDTVHILRLYGKKKSIKFSLFRLNCVKNFKFVLQTSIVNETAIKHVCETRPVLVAQGLLFYEGKQISFVCIDSDDFWRIMPDVFWGD
jgi:hypothetical protein